MRIYIFVDMEGISGVSGPDFVKESGSRYSEGRLLYTQDVNACVEECFNSGADSVIVRDGHGSGNHLLLEELDQRAECIQGATDRRFSYIEDADGVILLGYHAMAGTLGALLEHTYSSVSVQNLWLNGRKTGEIGIDASIAGEQGKPVIMVSGDDKACVEARDWIPGVVTCCVKDGISCFSAKLFPLLTAHDLIKEKTKAALQSLSEFCPVVPERPVRLKAEMVERVPVPNQYFRPDIHVLDARTYEVEAESVEEAFYRIF